MVHVGVDLDKHSSQIAVLSEDGEIVQHRLANDAARLEKFFAQLPPHTPIAIEASGTWWWLVDLLERLATTRSFRIPSRPRRSPPPASKAIASMPSASRSCFAAISCPPFGSRRRRCAKR